MTNSASTGLAAIFATGLLLGSTAPKAAEARFDWFRYSGSDPENAAQQVPAGSYRNPVLQGFYPDPSIVRVGEDFYLVNSTFSWFPGIPVWHSRDLVNWRQIGNAINRSSQLDFKGRELSQGVFAPAISWHEGTFYIVNTCLACGGNYIIKAKDPAGPWSDPVWFKELGWGIDPSLFFDNDGTAWLLNNDSPPGKEMYDGHRAVWIQRLDLKTLKLVGPRTPLIDGGVDPQTNPVWIEGPHMFRRGDWYYLTAAEGGTGDRHSQVVLRGRRAEGPFMPFRQNPILTQRDLDPARPFPITSAGHADLVDTPTGDWWAVFLATRPYRDDIYNTGRETFLLPVRWTEDGWPMILEPGKPIPHVASQPALPSGKKPPLPTNGPFTVMEQFDGKTLGIEWMMMRNPVESWHRLAGGALVLEPRSEGLGDGANPSFMARRQQHMNIEATTELRFEPGAGEAAGLAILQNDEFWYAFVVGQDAAGGREVRLLVRDGKEAPKEGRPLASAQVPSGPIRLRIVAEGERYHFDWASGGKQWNRLLADADGTVLSTWRARGFVGAMVGPYAVKEARK